MNAEAAIKKPKGIFQLKVIRLVKARKRKVKSARKFANIKIKRVFKTPSQTAKAPNILISPPPNPFGKYWVNRKGPKPKTMKPQTHSNTRAIVNAGNNPTKTRPAKTNRLLKECGKVRHLISLTAKRIKKLRKTRCVISKYGVGNSLREHIQKKSAVKASTTGYCHEIFDLQNLQRPPNRAKLMTGILSYQRIDFLHRGQKEEGATI